MKSPARKTLNVHVPWTSTLGMLGIEPDGSELPVRTTCPSCHKPRLAVYEDTIAGGAWHYCFACESSGDMIELTARAMKLTIREALQKLVSGGIPIPEELLTTGRIQTYIDEQHTRRKKVHDFMVMASKYLLKSASPALSKLRAYFRIHTHLPDSRWESGPGLLVGGLPHLTVESFFMPTFMKHRNAMPVTQKIFAGRNWSDVLVVPYYFGMDRISGFYFVGRDGQPQDTAFRRTACINPEITSMEAGLAGVPSLSLSRSLLGPYAVVFDNPFLPTRLQIRYAASSNNMLPLLAFYDGPRGCTTASAYRMLEKLPLFFGFRLTPQIVHQAIWTDGLISVPRMRVEPDQTAIDHYIRDHTPMDLLENVVKTAKPWRQFLPHWAKLTSDAIIDELLSGLERYGQPTLAKLAEAGDRFNRMAIKPPEYPTLRCGRFITYEKDGKTWAKEAGHEPVVVMNATIRVEQTYNDPERGILYAGTLTFQDTEIHFKLSARCFQKLTRLRDALQKLVTNAVLGGVFWLAPGWCRHVLSLGLHAHATVKH